MAWSAFNAWNDTCMCHSTLRSTTFNTFNASFIQPHWTHSALHSFNHMHVTLNSWFIQPHWTHSTLHSTTELRACKQRMQKFKYIYIQHKNVLIRWKSNTITNPNNKNAGAWAVLQDVLDRPASVVLILGPVFLFLFLFLFFSFSFFFSTAAKCLINHWFCWLVQSAGLVCWFSQLG